MKTDFLIVGQGICGTVLSWSLIKAGKKVMVIDEPQPFTSSKIASGLINPVTGMRLAKAWMIDDLLPVAMTTYRDMEMELGISIIEPISIVDFHTSGKAATTFYERVKQFPEYLHHQDDNRQFDQLFYYEHGIGIISPCFLIDIRQMLSAWRGRLQKGQMLVEERMDYNEVKVLEDKVLYKDIEAEKIIFCDGCNGAENPFFTGMPFAINKGEVLIAAIPDLPVGQIYKHKLKIAPWENGLFWVGSSFEWAFNDTYPSITFRENTEAELQKFLKLPYTIVDHFASLRPATVQHKPFVSMLPANPNVGIFNGMGAKGCSQAPYFANALMRHLVFKEPLMAIK